MPLYTPLRRLAGKPGVAIAVALVVALGGALAVRLTAGGPPAASPTRAATAGPAAAAAALDSLYRQISGGVPERLAGEQIRYRLAGEYTAQCLAKVGVTYHPAPFATAYEGRSDDDIRYGSGSGGWLLRPSTTDLGVARDRLDQAQAAAAAQVAPEVAAMSPADRASYDRQLAMCAAPASTYTGRDVPASSATLAQALDTLVAGVLAEPQLRVLAGGYPSCMAHAGYPGVTDPAGVTALVAAGFPALSQTPLDGSAGGTAWQAATTAEHAAAAGDTACRSYHYDQAIVAVAAALPAFRTRSADALAELHGEWSALDQAVFDPQPDPSVTPQE